MSARVLWLSAETPDRHGNGGARRQYHQIRALVGLGHRVEVCSLGGRRAAASIRALVPYHRYRFRLPRFLPNWLDYALAAGPREWDAIVLSHTESRWMLFDRAGSAELPILLDLHNVYSAWHTALGDAEAAAHAHAEEALALAAVGAVSTCSPLELDRLHEMHPGAGVEAFVAPLGVDPAEWPEEPYARDEPLVALFGSWAWRPNAAGLRWFAEQVWPLVTARMPQARALVAGSGAPTSLPSGMTAVGRVADLAAFTARATVVAAPVLEGVGAAVKFAESLATGAAVVATSDAASAHPEAPVFVSDDAADWAAFILERLERRSQEPVPAPSRAYALEHLDWARCVGPIDAWLARAAR